MIRGGKFKRYVGIAFSIILIVIGLFILVYTIKPFQARGQGALQVTSNVKAQVLLNGKAFGATPLCKCNQNETIKSGEYTLTIQPDDKSLESFVSKIKIEKGVLTAVERTFLPGAFASAYILNLDKTDSKDARLNIVSLPDGALVTLDGNPQGVTPYSLNNISASEHEIEVQKKGYGKKTMKVRTVTGYKLLAKVILGTEVKEQETSSPTPQPQPSTTPSPIQQQVTIKDTPTGFLRVRAAPSLGAAEIGRVLPGETYTILEEQAGWYKIKLKTGEEGWVSSSYAAK